MKNSNPVIIGTAARSIDINEGGLYDAVITSRRFIDKQATTTREEPLPFQLNIAMIQQVYLALTKETEITISGVTFSFLDDEWDFRSQYKPGKNISNYRFNFNYLGKKALRLTDYMKTVLKLYVIYVITEFGLDCGTNQAKIIEAKTLLLQMRSSHIFVVEALNLDDLKAVYENRNIQYRTMVSRRRYLQTFLTFYTFLTGHDVYTREMNQWVNDIDTAQITATIEEHKVPCPPTKFYQAFTKYHYDRVFDSSVPVFERGVSGLLYIGSQTGLRGSELTILTDDCIEAFSLDDHGLKRLSEDEMASVLFNNESDDINIKYVGILHYRSTKNGGRRGKVYTYNETNASKKVIHVVITLMQLFAEVRRLHDTDALVPNEDSTYRRSSYRPNIQETKLLNYAKRSCIQNASAWGLIDTSEAELFEGSITYDDTDYRAVKRSKKYSLTDMKKGGVNPGQTVSYITIRQFRRYVASDLHARGVDDRTISYLLGHHSIEMWGYYVYEAHPVQENIEFAREIVVEVVRDHTKILGPKGEAYEQRIEDIILNHRLNVQDDIDAVIDAVCGAMPIRAKLGGFCMKANPDRDCWYDGVTNEFFCAYGCCPNHCHMYFMVPITIQKARSIAKAMEYNIACDYVNAAEKEGFKLKTCLDNELIVEMQELQRVIADNGVSWVIDRHSDVAEIIDHMDSILKEIAEWQERIEQLMTIAN